MSPRITHLLRLTLAAALAFSLACGDDEETTAGDGDETSGGEDTASRGPDNGRCDTSGPGLETSEYDTSGDDLPDVRKVFRVVGTGRLSRLIMVCREADLNNDGLKDVVRYYNDEGSPLREEADRDFDGRLDEITFYENGRIFRKELDTNADGRVDTKIFYEEGRPTRTERDIAGRSTANEWRPDQWEYYEDGRLVRMGTDLDGDGRVDRWDRDADWQRAREEAARQEQMEEDADAEGDDGGDA